MQVRKIDTSRHADVRQFMQLPFDLYRNCPQWVPPIRAEMRKVFDRRHYPFYRHSNADFFVVEDEGRTVGRIAVLHNRNYTAYHRRPAAFFYYLDLIDDLRVARLLCDAAAEWAQQEGCNELIGPLGFMQGDGMGLLVEGFAHRPAMGIPYNYPYYGELLTRLGFEKATDFSSGYLRGDHALPERFFAVAERVKERRGLSVKSFTSDKELRAWAPRIGAVYNRAFQNNWEYAPLPEADLRVVADRLISIADPRLIKLVMKGEEIIGFCFAFPDISAAIQRTKGRIWPFGWFHLWREFKRTKWVNLNGLGLLPEHQGVGGNAILYTELVKSIHEFGFEHADLVQVEEENYKSRAEMSTLGVQWYKQHRIYRRAL